MAGQIREGFRARAHPERMATKTGQGRFGVKLPVQGSDRAGPGDGEWEVHPGGFGKPCSALGGLE